MTSSSHGVCVAVIISCGRDVAMRMSCDSFDNGVYQERMKPTKGQSLQRASHAPVYTDAYLNINIMLSTTDDHMCILYTSMYIIHWYYHIHNYT